ncbi:aspartyl protease family protein [Asticcacaulis excentricus]|uniref:aspartyl protease family protein n=1 Tax=Asticcacaulis excentricus TaxID=78587 RepID=UPI000F83E60F|nr:aspartyl protease family protein [Asticcacaulis excentricus]
MFTRRMACTGVLSAAIWPGMATAQEGVVRVPFTRSKSLMPVVAVTLNGKGPYQFVIDTGASATIVRQSLVKELGLRRNGEARGSSLSGTEVLSRHVATEVVIGGKLRVGELSVYASEGFEKQGFDGLLTANILTRLPCQLDYRAGEVRYYLDATQPMPLDGFGEIHASYITERGIDADKITVSIGFAGHSIDCLMDTGAGSALMLRGDYVRDYNLWDKYPLISEGQLRGVNGKALKTRLVEVKDIQVAGLWVPRMAVALGDPYDREGYNVRAPFQGILGAPFLSAFQLAFQPKSAVHIKASGGFAALAPPEKHVSNLPQTTPDRPVIPFRLGEDRRFNFVAEIDGKPLTGLLNLGDGTSSIGAETAAKFGLSKLAGGYDGAALSFGGVRRPGLTLRKARQPKQDLYLGADFVQMTPCRLDLDNKYMMCYLKGAPETTGYDRLPAQWLSDGTLMISGSLMDKPMRFRLDTGWGYGLILSSEAVKAHDLWDAFPKAENRLSGDGKGGMKKIRYTGAPRLDFGPYRIDPAPLTLNDPTGGGEEGYKGVDGVIGIGVLWRFNMIFVHDEVWFKPNQRFGYSPTSLPSKPAE